MRPHPEKDMCLACSIAVFVYDPIVSICFHVVYAIFIFLRRFPTEFLSLRLQFRRFPFFSSRCYFQPKQLFKRFAWSARPGSFRLFGSLWGHVGCIWYRKWSQYLPRGPQNAFKRVTRTAKTTPGRQRRHPDPPKQIPPKSHQSGHYLELFFHTFCFLFVCKNVAFCSMVVSRLYFLHGFWCTLEQMGTLRHSQAILIFIQKQGFRKIRKCDSRFTF